LGVVSTTIKLGEKTICSKKGQRVLHPEEKPLSSATQSSTFPRLAVADLQDSIKLMLLVCFLRIFNTNNLWVSMSAMKYVVEKHFLHMEIIVNPKVQLITVSLCCASK